MDNKNNKNFKGVFVFCEQINGEIHKVSYELLNKGRELSDALDEPLIAGVLGPSGIDVSELTYRGADKVFYLQNDEFKLPNVMAYKDALLDLLDELSPKICLFGATNFGRSLAPRIAIKLDTGLTADCTGLEIDEEDNTLVQIRPAFSENILAHIKTKTYPQIATVRYKEFAEAPRKTDREGEVIEKKYEFKSEFPLEILEKLREQSIDITEASVIIAGGRGLEGESDFKILKELAELLGGEVGASRDVVEEGYISKEHQVGYSGNRVKPRIYIACGISGAPQHIAGMQDSEVIIAINDDPSSPIFEIADYGIVADWRQVVQSLTKNIKAAVS